MASNLRSAIEQIVAALNQQAGRWCLRDEVEADQPFVDALYTAIRWDELAPVPWPDEAKRAFLREQSRLQADHYRRNYPGAALCVIERDQEAALDDAGRAVRVQVGALAHVDRVAVAIAPGRQRERGGRRGRRVVVERARIAEVVVALEVEVAGPDHARMPMNRRYGEPAFHVNASV